MSLGGRDVSCEVGWCPVMVSCAVTVLEIATEL